MSRTPAHPRHAVDDVCDQKWLGLAPSGKHVEMRVADWYRTDRDNNIIDNWVMIDLLNILHQMGLDVLDDRVTSPTLRSSAGPLQ